MAAILLAQLEQIDRFTRERRAIWARYHEGFYDLENAGIVRRPIVPEHCVHNGHLYYLLLRDGGSATASSENSRPTISSLLSTMCRCTPHLPVSGMHVLTAT